MIAVQFLQVQTWYKSVSGMREGGTYLWCVAELFDLIYFRMLNNVSL